MFHAPLVVAGAAVVRELRSSFVVPRMLKANDP
jgi:hypothetical protein